jgi:hypothetical protein
MLKASKELVLGATMSHRNRSLGAALGIVIALIVVAAFAASLAP